MLWSETTVLVGFIPDFDMSLAANYLKRVDGFRGIKHKYRLTNTVLVEVDPGRLNAFVTDVRRQDGVAYCEYNYLLFPNAFHEEIGDWSPASEWSCRLIRRLHNIRQDLDGGEGITIAVVDSGLSPHPYLPALSFSQSIAFAELWPDTVKRNVAAQAHLSSIAHLESSWPPPLSSNAGVQDQKAFLAQALNDLRSFQQEVWNEWLNEALDWYRTNLGSSRAGHGPVPNYPIHPRGICGPLRRVSLYSRNFVTDNLLVDDSLGHGTQMAGLLSGKPSVSPGEADADKKRQLSKYEVDVLGITPNAELMILKCYDKSDLQASNVGAMIRALEHAEKYNADIIYFGLAFDPGPRGIPTKTAISLDRTIQTLTQKKIPVICPAGNGHKPELEFPAACNGVIAVTAEVQDKKGGALLAPYSSYAGPGETVHFSAFGGDDYLAPISTDTSFGFRRVTGTSVAAAITTGILANYLSKRYKKLRHQQYENVLVQILRSGTPPSLPLPLTAVPRMRVDELINEASQSALPSDKVGAPYPSPKFGFGLIREFAP